MPPMGPRTPTTPRPITVSSSSNSSRDSSQSSHSSPTHSPVPSPKKPAATSTRQTTPPAEQLYNHNGQLLDQEQLGKTIITENFLNESKPVTIYVQTWLNQVVFTDSTPSPIDSQRHDFILHADTTFATDIEFYKHLDKSARLIHSKSQPMMYFNSRNIPANLGSATIKYVASGSNLMTQLTFPFRGPEIQIDSPHLNSTPDGKGLQVQYRVIYDCILTKHQPIQYPLEPKLTATKPAIDNLVNRCQTLLNFHRSMSQKEIMDKATEIFYMFALEAEHVHISHYPTQLPLPFDDNARLINHLLWERMLTTRPTSASTDRRHLRSSTPNIKQSIRPRNPTKAETRETTSTPSNRNGSTRRQRSISAQRQHTPRDQRHSRPERPERHDRQQRPDRPQESTSSKRAKTEQLTLNSSFTPPPINYRSSHYDDNNINGPKKYSKQTSPSKTTVSIRLSKKIEST